MADKKIYPYVHEKDDIKNQAYAYGIRTTRVKDHHRYYLVGVYTLRDMADNEVKGDQYNPKGLVFKVKEQKYMGQKSSESRSNYFVGYAAYTYYPQEE